MTISQKIEDFHINCSHLGEADGICFNCTLQFANELIEEAAKIAKEFDTTVINYEPKDKAIKIRIAEAIRSLAGGE